MVLHVGVALVEPSWSLNVTQGEMTSSITVPRCASAVLEPQQLLLPENDRQSVARRLDASAGVDGGRSLTTPACSEIRRRRELALRRGRQPLSSMMCR